jgi:hypothetical protein
VFRFRGGVVAISGSALGGALDPGPEVSVLSITSGPTDDEPDASVDLPSGFGDYRDAAIGDFNDIEVQLNQTGSYSVYFTDTLTDPIGDPATINGVDTLPAGTHNFRQRLRRTGARASAYSNVVAHTISAATDDDDYTAWLAAA